MKENKIASKNYIIIALIFAATISLTLYLCNCYSVYNEGKKEIPVIRGVISEITTEDFDHYILENQSALVYICTASDMNCRNFEKDFIKFIKRDNLQDEIIYLNVSNLDADKFVEDFNKKYNYRIPLTKNYPALIMFENGKICGILQGKSDKKITISRTKQFIEMNKIGE